MTTVPPKTIGIPVFDHVDLFDVAGPVEVFGTSLLGPENPLSVKLVSMKEDLEFTTSRNVAMRADVTRSDAPQFDVLLVPGGPGVNAMMESSAVRAWLSDQAASADCLWVTSVCAGALLLGAAGLLAGYSATTHWASLPALRAVPGVLVASGYPRVVVSGNRMTSGGVSASLDLAVTLQAALLGNQAGRNTELLLQYDPRPPFGVGRPDLADPETLAGVAAGVGPLIAKRVEILNRLFGGAGRE